MLPNLPNAWGDSDADDTEAKIGRAGSASDVRRHARSMGNLHGSSTGVSLAASHGRRGRAGRHAIEDPMSVSVRPRPGFDPGAGARAARGSSATGGRRSMGFGGLPEYDASADPNCPINRTGAFQKRVRRSQRAERAEYLSARRKWLSRGQPTAARGSAADTFLSEGGKQALARTGQSGAYAAGLRAAAGATGGSRVPSTFRPEFKVLLDSPVAAGSDAAEFSVPGGAGSAGGVGGSRHDAVAVRRAARSAAVDGVSRGSAALGVRRHAPPAGAGFGRGSESVTEFEASGILAPGGRGASITGHGATASSSSISGRVPLPGRLPSLPPQQSPEGMGTSGAFGGSTRDSLHIHPGASDAPSMEELDALHRDCVVAAVQREELLRRAVRLGAVGAEARKSALASAPTGTQQQRHALAAARAESRRNAEELAYRLREAGLYLVEAVARWRYASRRRWYATREEEAVLAGAVPVAFVQLADDARARELATGPVAGQEGGGHWPPFDHGGVPYLAKAMGDLHVVGAALPQLLPAVKRRDGGLSSMESHGSSARGGGGGAHLESKSGGTGDRDGYYRASAVGTQGHRGAPGEEEDEEEELPALDGNPLLLGSRERRAADAARRSASADPAVTDGPQLLPPPQDPEYAVSELDADPSGDAGRLLWAHGYMLDETEACGRMQVGDDGFLDFIPPQEQAGHSGAGPSGAELSRGSGPTAASGDYFAGSRRSGGAVGFEGNDPFDEADGGDRETVDGSQLGASTEAHSSSIVADSRVRQSRVAALTTRPERVAEAVRQSGPMAVAGARASYLLHEDIARQATAKMQADEESREQAAEIARAAELRAAAEREAEEERRARDAEGLPYIGVSVFAPPDTEHARWRRRYNRRAGRVGGGTLRNRAPAHWADTEPPAGVTLHVWDPFEASIVIQALVRGVQTRVRVARLRGAAVRAATNMQRLWRGLIGRRIAKEFRRVVGATRLLQRVERGRQGRARAEARRLFLATSFAASMLQRAFRGGCGRRRLGDRRRMLQAAEAASTAASGITLEGLEGLSRMEAPAAPLLTLLQVVALLLAPMHDVQDELGESEAELPDPALCTVRSSLLPAVDHAQSAAPLLPRSESIDKKKIGEFALAPWSLLSERRLGTAGLRQQLVAGARRLAEASRRGRVVLPPWRLRAVRAMLSDPTLCVRAVVAAAASPPPAPPLGAEVSSLPPGREADPSVEGRSGPQLADSVLPPPEGSLVPAHRDFARGQLRQRGGLMGLAVSSAKRPRPVSWGSGSSAAGAVAGCLLAWCQSLSEAAMLAPQFVLRLEGPRGVADCVKEAVNGELAEARALRYIDGQNRHAATIGARAGPTERIGTERQSAENNISRQEIRRLLGPVRGLPRPVVFVVSTETALVAYQRLMNALRAECAGAFTLLPRVLEDGIRPDLRAWAVESDVDQQSAPGYDAAMAPGAQPLVAPMNAAGAPLAIDEGMPPTHRELQRILSSGRCAITYLTAGRTPAGRSRAARALAQLRKLRPRPRVVLLVAPTAPRAGMLRASSQAPPGLPGSPDRVDVFGAALWRDQLGYSAPPMGGEGPVGDQIEQQSSGAAGAGAKLSMPLPISLNGDDRAVLRRLPDSIAAVWNWRFVRGWLGARVLLTEGVLCRGGWVMGEWQDVEPSRLPDALSLGPGGGLPPYASVKSGYRDASAPDVVAVPLGACPLLPPPTHRDMEQMQDAAVSTPSQPSPLMQMPPSGPGDEVLRLGGGIGAMELTPSDHALFSYAISAAIEPGLASCLEAQSEACWRLGGGEDGVRLATESGANSAADPSQLYVSRPDEGGPSPAFGPGPLALSLAADLYRAAAVDAPPVGHVLVAEALGLLLAADGRQVSDEREARREAARYWWLLEQKSRQGGHGDKAAHLGQEDTAAHLRGLLVAPMLRGAGTLWDSARLLLLQAPWELAAKLRSETDGQSHGTPTNGSSAPLPLGLPPPATVASVRQRLLHPSWPNASNGASVGNAAMRALALWVEARCCELYLRYSALSAHSEMTIRALRPHDGWVVRREDEADEGFIEGGEDEPHAAGAVSMTSTESDIASKYISDRAMTAAKALVAVVPGRVTRVVHGSKHGSEQDYTQSAATLEPGATQMAAENMYATALEADSLVLLGDGHVGYNVYAGSQREDQSVIPNEYYAGESAPTAQGGIAGSVPPVDTTTGHSSGHVRPEHGMGGSIAIASKRDAYDGQHAWEREAGKTRTGRGVATVDGDGGDGGWLRALDEVLRSVLRDSRVWLGVSKVPGDWEHSTQEIGNTAFVAGTATLQAFDGTKGVEKSGILVPKSMLGSILQNYGDDKGAAEVESGGDLRVGELPRAGKTGQGEESLQLCTIAAFHAFGRMFFCVYHQRAAVWRVIATHDDEAHIAAVLQGTPQGTRLHGMVENLEARSRAGLGEHGYTTKTGEADASGGAKGLAAVSLRKKLRDRAAQQPEKSYTVAGGISDSLDAAGAVVTALAQYLTFRRHPVTGRVLVSILRKRARLLCKAVRLGPGALPARVEAWRYPSGALLLRVHPSPSLRISVEYQSPQSGAIASARCWEMELPSWSLARVANSSSSPAERAAIASGDLSRVAAAVVDRLVVARWRAGGHSALLAALKETDERAGTWAADADRVSGSSWAQMLYESALSLGATSVACGIRDNQVGFIASEGAKGKFANIAGNGDSGGGIDTIGAMISLERQQILQRIGSAGMRFLQLRSEELGGGVGISGHLGAWWDVALAGISNVPRRGAAAIGDAAEAVFAMARRAVAEGEKKSSATAQSGAVGSERTSAPAEAVSMALLPLSADGTALLRAGQASPLSLRIHGPGGRLLVSWAQRIAGELRLVRVFVQGHQPSRARSNGLGGKPNRGTGSHADTGSSAQYYESQHTPELEIQVYSTVARRADSVQLCPLEQLLLLGRAGIGSSIADVRRAVQSRLAQSSRSYLQATAAVTSRPRLDDDGDDGPANIDEDVQLALAVDRKHVMRSMAGSRLTASEESGTWVDAVEAAEARTDGIPLVVAEAALDIAMAEQEQSAGLFLESPGAHENEFQADGGRLALQPEDDWAGGAAVSEGEYGNTGRRRLEDNVVSASRGSQRTMLAIADRSTGGSRGGGTMALYSRGSNSFGRTGGTLASHRSASTEDSSLESPRGPDHGNPWDSDAMELPPESSGDDGLSWCRPGAGALGWRRFRSAPAAASALISRTATSSSAGPSTNWLPSRNPSSGFGRSNPSPALLHGDVYVAAPEDHRMPQGKRPPQPTCTALSGGWLAGAPVLAVADNPAGSVNYAASPASVAKTHKQSSAAMRTIVDRKLLSTAIAVGQYLVRVSVVLSARDVSRPSGELCIERGEGGGGDLPDRLDPWRPGVVLLVDPVGQARLPSIVRVDPRPDRTMGNSLTAAPVGRLAVHSGDPYRNAMNASSVLTREGVVGSMTSYPRVFGLDVENVNAEGRQLAGDPEDTAIGPVEEAEAERMRMHGTYGARAKGGWEIVLSCEYTQEALRRAAVESIALAQVGQAKQLEGGGLSDAVLQSKFTGSGGSLDDDSASAANVTFGVVARRMHRLKQQGRPAVSAASGKKAVQSLFPGRNMSPVDGMSLASGSVWPPPVDSKTRGDSLRALLMLLPMSLQWVEGSQAKMELAMEAAGPEVGPLGPSRWENASDEAIISAADRLQRRLGGPALLSLACNNALSTEGGGSRVQYTETANLLSILLASMPGREPRGIAVHAGAAMQHVRVPSFAYAWAGANSGLQTASAIVRRGTLARSAAASSILMAIPYISEGALALAASDAFPGSMDRGLRSALGSAWTGDAQWIWSVAANEWRAEYSANPKRAAAVPSPLAEHPAGFDMERGSGFHPEDEDYEGPAHLDSPEEMSRYLLASQGPGLSGSVPGGLIDASAELVAAHASVFASQLPRSTRLATAGDVSDLRGAQEYESEQASFLVWDSPIEAGLAAPIVVFGSGADAAENESDLASSEWIYQSGPLSRPVERLLASVAYNEAVRLAGEQGQTSLAVACASVLTSVRAVQPLRPEVGNVVASEGLAGWGCRFVGSYHSDGLQSEEASQAASAGSDREPNDGLKPINHPVLHATVDPVAGHLAAMLVRTATARRGASLKLLHHWKAMLREQRAAGAASEQLGRGHRWLRIGSLGRTATAPGPSPRRALEMLRYCGMIAAATLGGQRCSQALRHRVAASMIRVQYAFRNAAAGISSPAVGTQGSSTTIEAVGQMLRVASAAESMIATTEGPPVRAIRAPAARGCGAVVPLRNIASPVDAAAMLHPVQVKSSLLATPCGSMPEEAVRRLLLGVSPDLSVFGATADSSMVGRTNAAGRRSSGGRPPSRPGTPIETRRGHIRRQKTSPTVPPAAGPPEFVRKALSGRILRKAVRLPVMLRDDRGNLPPGVLFHNGRENLDAVDSLARVVDVLGGWLPASISHHNATVGRVIASEAPRPGDLAAAREEAATALGLPRVAAAAAAVHVQALAAVTSTPASALEAVAGTDRVGVAVAAAEHAGFKVVPARVATLTVSLGWALVPIAGSGDTQSSDLGKVPAGGDQEPSTSMEWKATLRIDAYCGDSSSRSRVDVVLDAETLGRLAPTRGQGCYAHVRDVLAEAVDIAMQAGPAAAPYSLGRNAAFEPLLTVLKSVAQSWTDSRDRPQKGRAALWIGPPDARPSIAARCAVLLRRKWIRAHAEAAAAAARASEQTRLETWAASEQAKGRLDKESAGRAVTEGLRNWEEKGGAARASQAAEAQALQASQLLPAGTLAGTYKLLEEFDGAKESSLIDGQTSTDARDASRRFLRAHQYPVGEDWRQWAKLALLDVCIEDSAVRGDGDSSETHAAELSADERAEVAAGDLDGAAVLDALSRSSPDQAAQAGAMQALTASVVSAGELQDQVGSISGQGAWTASATQDHIADEAVCMQAARDRLPGVAIGRVARAFLQSTQPGAFSLVLTGNPDVDRDRPSKAAASTVSGLPASGKQEEGVASHEGEQRSGVASGISHEAGLFDGLIGLGPRAESISISASQPPVAASGAGEDWSGADGAGMTAPAYDGSDGITNRARRPDPLCRAICKTMPGDSRLILTAYPVLCKSVVASDGGPVGWSPIEPIPSGDSTKAAISRNLHLLEHLAPGTAGTADASHSVPLFHGTSGIDVPTTPAAVRTAHEAAGNLKAAPPAPLTRPKEWVRKGAERDGAKAGDKFFPAGCHQQLRFPAATVRTSRQQVSRQTSKEEPGPLGTGFALFLQGYDYRASAMHDLLLPPEAVSALLWDAACAEATESEDRPIVSDGETLSCAPSLLPYDSSMLYECVSRWEVAMEGILEGGRRLTDEVEWAVRSLASRRCVEIGVWSEAESSNGIDASITKSAAGQGSEISRRTASRRSSHGRSTRALAKHLAVRAAGWRITAPMYNTTGGDTKGWGGLREATVQLAQASPLWGFTVATAAPTAAAAAGMDRGRAGGAPETGARAALIRLRLLSTEAVAAIRSSQVTPPEDDTATWHPVAESSTTVTVPLVGLWEQRGVSDGYSAQQMASPVVHYIRLTLRLEDTSGVDYTGHSDGAAASETKTAFSRRMVLQGSKIGSTAVGRLTLRGTRLEAALFACLAIAEARKGAVGVAAGRLLTLASAGHERSGGGASSSTEGSSDILRAVGDLMCYNRTRDVPDASFEVVYNALLPLVSAGGSQSEAGGSTPPSAGVLAYNLRRCLAGAIAFLPSRAQLMEQAAIAVASVDFRGSGAVAEHSSVAALPAWRSIGGAVGSADEGMLPCEHRDRVSSAAVQLVLPEGMLAVAASRSEGRSDTISSARQFAVAVAPASWADDGEKGRAGDELNAGDDYPAGLAALRLRQKAADRRRLGSRASYEALRHLARTTSPANLCVQLMRFGLLATFN